MTVPARILNDCIKSFQRKPIVYVLDIPGYRFGEAMVHPAQRVVAMSGRLYRLVDARIRMNDRDSLDDRADVRHSAMLTGDEVVVGVFRNDGPGEVHIKVEDLEG